MARKRVKSKAATRASPRSRDTLARLAGALISDALDAGEPLECLDRIATMLRRELQLAVCSLFLLDDDGQIQHDAHAGAVGIDYRLGHRAPRRGNVIARCLRSGVAQYVADVRSDPGHVPTTAPVRSQFVIPLKFRDQLLGALNLETNDPRDFASARRTRLLGLAGRLASLIHLAATAHRLLATKQALEAANRRLTATARKLRRLATRDALTQLPNRRQFEESVTLALARRRRTGEHVSLMMIDVDHFKAYNDRYGHLRGDRALARLARALKSALRRETDFLARFGGEEFAAIVCCDPGGAAILADRVRAAVRAAAIRHEGSPKGVVTVSIGVARAGPRATRDSLLQRAHRALYVAKRAGRDCARVSA
jgi:diguanylate cyclase (GGDEF)-like protein